MNVYEFEKRLALGTALFKNDIDEVVKLAKQFAVVDDWSEIPDYCEVMTIETFVSEVDSGLLTDYDGYGRFANLSQGLQCTNCPVGFGSVSRGELPELRYDVTHVAWFNK